MSSEILGKDIEEVREKVQRMKKERTEKEGEGVRRAKEGVVRCYLYVSARGSRAILACSVRASHWKGLENRRS